MAIPGLKVVAPSTPADVVGLMAAAIRDPDPVIFCEHKGLFATKGEVPDGEHVVPLGKAAVLRAGSDVTIVALAAMVPRALEAAERLDADHGIDAEVIDLRSLVPLDVADDPPIGREDEPPLHRRGEPAAVRLGRRDRLDRRRRGLLQPRRADRPDHDAARAAAVARPPSRTPRSRPSSGSSTPSGAASRPRSSAMTTVARRRDRPDGHRDGPRAARRRTRRARLQPDPRRGPTVARRDRGDGRADARRRRLARRRHASRCSPTTPRSATSTAGRTACSRARTPAPSSST